MRQASTSLRIALVALENEQDVVLARQRTRQIATLAGLAPPEATRLASAASEVSRNALVHAQGGRLSVEGDPERPLLLVTVEDRGPGVADLPAALEGRAGGGADPGLVGVRRLVDHFEIESGKGGTRVVLGQALPGGALRPEDVSRLAAQLARLEPESAYDEIRRQNRDLVEALDKVRTQAQLLERQRNELAQLNHELEDTNRGVVALYAELDERADFLQRVNEIKTRFLSNMTHEFRTPLTSILSLTRLLLDRVDGELTPGQETQVQYIRHGAESLLELVNDLLDLAKVEAGRITVRPGEFTVADLFGALRGMLRPLLVHNTAVALVFEDPQGLPPLRTDEGKVSQILRNFISNGLKYTERGEVRVSARAGPGDAVVFSVADTGIGIAPEDQGRIFEEFVQVENRMQRKARGTGLGLSLSRRLAGLLGGELRLQSAPGKGSTFELAVPRVYAGEEGALVVPEAAEAPAEAAGRPLLVVEDNPESIFLYEKFLQGTGWRLVAARTLAEARRALARERPAAVLLDVLLETENTWSLLSDLKNEPATRDIPVLVATQVDNERKARALGADAFFRKPVERADLVAALSSLASGRPAPEVLVVDGDEPSRYVLRGLLAEHGCRVREAGSARDGLALARTERPAAIFLALGLPDQPGEALLDTLASDPATRSIPVVLHTARLLAEEELRRLGARTVAFVPKGAGTRQEEGRLVRQALEAAGLVPGPAREGVR